MNSEPRSLQVFKDGIPSVRAPRPGSLAAKMRVPLQPRAPGIDTMPSSKSLTWSKDKVSDHQAPRRGYGTGRFTVLVSRALLRPVRVALARRKPQPTREWGRFQGHGLDFIL